FGGSDGLGCAHLAGRLDLAVPLYDRDDVATDGTGNLHEHEADRAAAEYHDRVADLDAGFMQTTKDTSQRLGHGSVFKADIGGNDEHGGFHHPARPAERLLTPAR